MLLSKFSLLLALLAALGCSAPRPERGRVLVVGIDGASMRVIKPMIAAGRLPHLAAIANAGASGMLHTLPFRLSPRIWTSVATGKLPRDHGINGWVLSQREAGGEVTRLYDSHDRKAHALWNILSAHGMRVAVVNWLMTYPPEPVNGVMITDYAYPEEVSAKRALGQRFAKAAGGRLREAPELLAPTAYPEEWAARAVAERHRAPLIEVPDPFAALTNTTLWAWLARGSRVASRDQGLVSVALEVEAEIDPTLLMVLLQGIDRVSHFAFGTLADVSTYPAAYQEPRSERLLGREALLGFYEYTDALIGRLVERYGEDDLILVLSDHGFRRAAEFPAGEHGRGGVLDGVIFARGPGIAPGSAVKDASVLDVTPSILAWLGLPAGEDMSGNVASFLDVERVPPIASYEGTPLPRLPRTESGGEEERLEQLRALGYID